MVAVVALIVARPSVLKLNSQPGVAVGTVTSQLLPSVLSVTTPLGVPPPGASTLSAKLEEVGWLIGLCAGPLTVIVVAAAST